MLRWNDLLVEPEASRHQAALVTAHRKAGGVFGALKDAAIEFLEAQIELSFVVRTAQDSGRTVADMYMSWLDIPAEQAVIEARVESGRDEELNMQLVDEVDAILTALREHGYPLPRPEDWVHSETDAMTSGNGE